MKERESGNQKDLTRQANSHNLEERGDIFMPEGQNGGPENREVETNHTPEHAIGSTAAEIEHQEVGHKASDRLHVEVANLALQRMAGAKRTENILREALDNADLREKWKTAGINLDSTDAILHNTLNYDELEKAAVRNIEERKRAALRAEGKDREPIYVPKSLEELAILVMNRATPEYKKHGEKCLVNFKKDANGEDTDVPESVNTDHFLDWARNNYYKVHAANPTSEVNFFGDIATNVRSEGIGGTISFYEITYTDSYYLKEVRDEQTGELVGLVEDKEYKALQEQMLMEVFLLQIQRNPAVSYVAGGNRAQKDNMVKTLSQAMVLNPLTRSNFMERILTAPSMNKTSIIDFDPSKQKNRLTAKLEGNFSMGTATREALAAYMNVFDYKQLKQILGEDAPLFVYETEKWDEHGISKTGETIKTSPAIEPGGKDRSKWFNGNKLKLYKANSEGVYLRQNGDLVEDSGGDQNSIPHPDFMKHVNIFLTPSPDQRQQDEIRERIILSIMHRNGITYREAQIAELMAYSLAQINGVAARMDTDAVGFDYWTRLVSIRDKRKREKSPGRNSPYGNPFNIEGIKRVGLTFFEAAKDLRGRSVRKIIMGGEGRNISIQDDPLKKRVEYEKENGKIKFVDENGNAVDVGAVKHEWFNEKVNFTDGEGDQRFRLERRLRFLDKDGKVIDTKNFRPVIKIEDVKEKIVFAQDIQKQFMPNHLLTAIKIYEWISEGKELDLPSLVIGRDSRGNAILDHKKIDEIKDGIEHDIRYMISTWGQINFGEKHVEWEKVEVRKDGKLVDDKGRFLDENWNVLDSSGKKTGERSDPKTYSKSREMTVLESMFDADALQFIQFEIERKGIATGDKNNPDHFIYVKNPNTGAEVTVDISQKNGKEFREAVWQGMFEYLVAKEIEAHRTRGSGYQYYDFGDLVKVKAALEKGQILESKSIDYISQKERITDGRIFAEAVGYALLSGSLEGSFNAFKVFLKSLLS